MNVVSNFTNPAALEGLIRVATTPKRWESMSHLAEDAGLVPATISHVRAGRRALSVSAAKALAVTLDIDVAALLLPDRAVPGDLASDRIVRELEAISVNLTAIRRRVELRGVA